MCLVSLTRVRMQRFSSLAGGPRPWAMPNPSARKRFKLRDAKHSLLAQLADFSCIYASVVISVTFYPPASHAVALHNSVAAVAGVLFCFAGTAHRLYQSQWLQRPVADEVRRIGLCWVWVVGPLMTVGFATKVLSYFSRVATFSWILLAPALILLYRLLARAGARKALSARRRAAIAGVSRFGEHIWREIQNEPSLGLNVVGLFDDRSVARQESNGVTLRSAGSFAQLITAAREGLIDVVYIALPLRAEQRARELIRLLQDTTVSVYVAFDFVSLAGGGYRNIAFVGNQPVVPLLVGAEPSVGKQALTIVRTLRNLRPSRRIHVADSGRRPRPVQSLDHAKTPASEIGRIGLGGD